MNGISNALSRNKLKNSKLICTCFLFLALVQCNRGFSPEKYVAIYEKNKKKWAWDIERNGYRMLITPMPGAYFAAKTIMFDTTVDRKEIIQRYSKSIFFIVSIAPQDKKRNEIKKPNRGNLLNKEEIIERIYDNEAEALLVHDNDTIPALQCRYERDWENETVGTYTISFEYKEKLKKYDLVLRGFKTEIGTVAVPFAKLVKKRITLRG